MATAYNQLNKIIIRDINRNTLHLFAWRHHLSNSTIMKIEDVADNFLRIFCD